MKKLALISLLALVAAAPASAKELQSVAVCGVSDCVVFKSRRQADLLAHVGDTVTTTAPAGPYYTLTFKGNAEGEEHGWKSFYVPSTKQMVAVDDSTQLSRWMATLPGAQKLIARAIESLEPFPTPRVEYVRIDGNQVAADAQSYLRLFDVASAGTGEPTSYDWVAIDLVSSGTTPWTGSDRDLMFSPSGRLIERGGAQVRIDDGLAADIAAGRTLSFDGDGFAWLTLAVVFGALAAAIALGLGLQRSRAPGVGGVGSTEPPRSGGAGFAGAGAGNEV
jgi:hypothetical protein